MKQTVKIHTPKPSTVLPHREVVARNRRAKASLPVAPRPTRATHPPTPAAPVLHDAHEAEVSGS